MGSIKTKAAFLALLVLISIAHCEFTVREVKIDISVDSNGDAVVVEKVALLMEGEESISKYATGLENPTLAKWQEIVKSDLIRLHIDRNFVDVQELYVRPQPIYSYNPLNNIAKGEILISYKAKRYLDKDKTGLFVLEKVKPRTYKLVLNDKALSFETSPAGNIVINEKTTLKITPPPGSILLDINPIPGELRETQLPTKLDYIEWNDIVLVSPSLVFQYNETIGDEIYLFFQDAIRSTLQFLSTSEGMIIIVFILLGFVFYAQLRAKIRDLREHL